MDAIAINDKEIVDCSCKFIDDLDDEESKYISKLRLKLKAKASVVFSLLSPDSTFDELKNKFKLVDLESKCIIDAFKFLDDVLID